MGFWRLSAPPTTPGHHPISRIRKELRTLWIDPPAFCRPGASPVTGPFRWEVVIDGPDGSPYAGGTFPVDVAIPKHYPFRPPKITFKTKVYHPNIDEDGKMFMEIFKGKWSPALTIHGLLLSIVSVLYDPLLDRPIRVDIAYQYKYERDVFEATAEDWTRRYASAPVVSFYPPGKEAGSSGCDSGSSIESPPRFRFATNGRSAAYPVGRGRNLTKGETGVALPREDEVIPLLWSSACSGVSSGLAEEEHEKSSRLSKLARSIIVSVCNVV